MPSSAGQVVGLRSHDGSPARPLLIDTTPVAAGSLLPADKVIDPHASTGRHVDCLTDNPQHDSSSLPQHSVACGPIIGE